MGGKFQMNKGREKFLKFYDFIHKGQKFVCSCNQRWNLQIDNDLDPGRRSDYARKVYTHYILCENECLDDCLGEVGFPGGAVSSWYKIGDRIKHGALIQNAVDLNFKCLGQLLIEVMLLHKEKIRIDKIE